MRHDVQQQRFIELEGARELLRELPHGVQPLKEDRIAVAIVVVCLEAASVAERVAKAEPILLDEHAQAVHGAVVRVGHKLHQAADLAGAVHAVLATHKDGLAKQHHQQPFQGGPQQGPDVLQPARLVEKHEPVLVAGGGRVHTQLVQAPEALPHGAKAFKLQIFIFDAQVVIHLQGGLVLWLLAGIQDVVHAGRLVPGTGSATPNDVQEQLFVVRRARGRAL
mmetsp:Transcript_22686/g.56915  ORF Transcript_22686/g.56915 Transcript_22686/m.56915 type:complete len:222 (-) Transcript_22686:171-836(-)